METLKELEHKEELSILTILVIGIPVIILSSYLLLTDVKSGFILSVDMILVTLLLIADILFLIVVHKEDKLKG